MNTLHDDRLCQFDSRTVQPVVAALNPFDAPPRAFISYARSDGAGIASTLRTRLAKEHHEITLWLDRAQMVGGIGWWKQITEAIDKVEILILVMTRAAAVSEIAAKEWRYARQQGVRVCPVFKAGAEPNFDALPRWMRKAHFYDLDKEWETFVAYLQSGGKSARVPFMAPDLPSDFVVRPTHLEALLTRLLDDTGENPRSDTLVLHGAGGFGKTTLACMVCHKEHVISAFDDGILWVRLGETPNIQGELTKLYGALTGDRPPFVDIDDASIQFAERLEDRNCLLVIDDVWNPSDLKPFLRGGPHCARLITTRQLDVVTEVGAERTVVDRMTSEQAVRMLTARLNVVPGDHAALEALAERLGEWPLLLKLASSRLRERVGRGDTLNGAIGHIGKALDRKGVVAFDRTTSPNRNDAIASAVGASLEVFQDEDQVRCIELAVFRSDVSIPVATAGALWNLDEFDTEDLVQRLDSAALLDFDLKTGTLRVHSVLRAFFESQLGELKGLHERLVERWLASIYELTDSYAWTWVGWHLTQAGKSDRLEALLLDFDWLLARLRVIPIQPVLQDFELLPDSDDLRIVRDALRLSTHGLTFDTDQLRVQLVGRIDRGRSEAIDKLLDVARTSAGGMYLELAGSTLTHPGGALTAILKSHSGAVITLAVSPDGRFAVSGSDDWTLRLWELRTNRLVRTFDGHKGIVHAVAFSADGRSMFSASEDRTLRQWDVGSGTVQEIYRGHTLAVKGLAIRGDDKVAATISEDGSLRIWELATKATRIVFKSREHQLNGVVFAEDGDMLVFGSGDWSIRMASLNTNEVHTLEGHSGMVRCLDLVPGGEKLVSGADDGVVRIWSVPNGDPIRVLSGHDGGVEAIAVTADGARIVSGGRDKTIRVWDLETGETLHVFEGHAGYVKTVAVSPTTGQVVSGSTDQTIRQWNIDAAANNAVTGAHRDAVALLSLSEDGRRMVSGTQSDALTVWDTQAEESSHAVGENSPAAPLVVGRLEGHWGPINTLQLAGNGTQAFSGSRDRTVRVWDVERLTVWEVFKGHSREVVHLDVSADGSRVVSIARDHTVRVWDVKSRRFLRVLVSAENSHVLASLEANTALAFDFDTPTNVDVVDKPIPRGTRIAVSPDGKCVALGYHGNVCAWDLESGITVYQELGDIDVRTIAFNPTSTSVLLGTLFGPILIWDMKGSPNSLEGHSRRVLDAIALADGNTVISAARDDTIRTWDLETRSQTAQVNGPVGSADTVAIAPGGHFAYSVYGDTVVAFDLKDSRQFGSLSFDHQVTTIAVTPSGRYVAIGDQSGQIHFLSLRYEEQYGS